MEHGAAGEGLTEGEKKASLEVGAFFPFFLEIVNNLEVGAFFSYFSLEIVKKKFSSQAISRKSKRRVHYQKFVKVIFQTNNQSNKRIANKQTNRQRNKNLVYFTIYVVSVAQCSFLICQGKDSSNYSAEDMGCILGTKSEKVTTMFLHFVLLVKTFHQTICTKKCARLEQRPEPW